MNLSYNNYPPLYYSTVMQPIPSISSPIQLNDNHTKMMAQSPRIRYRPYNHFPTTITPTFNALSTHEPRASAFKVVAKRSKYDDILPDTALKLCPVASNQYQLLNSAKLIAPVNSNCADGSKLLSTSNSYESTATNVEVIGISPLNLKKNAVSHETISHSTSNSIEMACDLTTQQQPKINNAYQTEKNQPVIQYRYTAQDSQYGKVYQWESLLPIIPEPMEKSEITVPLKKFHTQSQRHEEIAKQQLAAIKEKDVPVIDLTLNEDGDFESELHGKRSRSLIELNVTPPLDINGNEIIMKTDTKTMQAISYKKKKPTDTNELNLSSQQAMKNPETVNAANASPSDICSQQINCPTLQSNLMQNGFRMRDKWLRYLRSYNGFRLFAQRYYRKAQAYLYTNTNFRLQSQNSSRTRLFIESVLLKWWNLMNATEKEQYVQMAEMQRCRSTKNDTEIKQ